MQHEIKPPVTRIGKTHTYGIGAHAIHITVNRREDGYPYEIFGHADAASGLQGHLDRCCTMISLGLQGRATPETVARHLRYDRTEPCGGVGQPTSIYDAIGRAIMGDG